jgi:hypothetical protein
MSMYPAPGANWEASLATTPATTKAPACGVSDMKVLGGLFIEEPPKLTLTDDAFAPAIS